MACAIEDAGFEVRDQMMWVYGSGFPKSHNISKAIDKNAGVEPKVVGRNPNSRENSKKEDNLYDAGTVGKTAMITAPETAAAKQWDGWGTALKPAHEPIVLARKPLEGTVVDNIRKWGVGGLNIDGCRVGTEERTYDLTMTSGNFKTTGGGRNKKSGQSTVTGRFPANLMHDGSQEVLDLFPGDEASSPARFFYCPKASKSDRDDGCDKLELKRTAKLAGPNNDRENLDGLSERFRTTPSKNNHPTVKPTALMQYLCRLITPPGGTVLDPFSGSGSTGRGAVSQGFNFIGIELSPDYVEIAKARIEAVNTP
jgi:site-specific DNA-methyltransferase (adenine-specific)